MQERMWKAIKRWGRLDDDKNRRPEGRGVARLWAATAVLTIPATYCFTSDSSNSIDSGKGSAASPNPYIMCFTGVRGG